MLSLLLITWDDIGDTSGKALIETLRTNTTLTFLNVDCNFQKNQISFLNSPQSPPPFSPPPYTDNKIESNTEEKITKLIALNREIKGNARLFSQLACTQTIFF